MDIKTNNNTDFKISEQSEKVNKKLIFFMICSIVFGRYPLCRINLQKVQKMIILLH